MFGIKHRIQKTPTVLQAEAVECGAASLGMILGYYGKFVPLEELRYECGVSRDGSNALNVIKAARHYGLEAKGKKTDIEHLAEYEFPVILFWGFSHFLVLEGIKKGTYYLNDPALGHRRCDETEFRRLFTGIVLTFKPGDGFEKSGKKEGGFIPLLKEIKADKSVLFFLLLCAFLMTVSGIMIPAFSRIFIDSILIPERSEWLAPLIGVMALTAGLTGLVLFLQHKTLLKLENSIAVSKSSSFFDHAIRLPLKFYSQRYAGTLYNVMNSGEQLARSLGNEFLMALLNIFFASFFVVIMLQYDVLLTLVSSSFIILNIIAVYYSGKRIREEYHVLLADEAKLSGIAVSGVQSIETLKATGQESIFFTRLVDQYTMLQNMMFRITKKTQLFGMIPKFSEFVSVVLLLLIGGLKIMDGSLTVGEFVAFQALTAALYVPVQRFMSLLLNLQKSDADKKRIEDVMKYPEDAYLHRNVEESDSDVRKLQGKIGIRGLSFGYSRLDNPLIEDFNLDVEPGKRIAFVGVSGSGKTTLGKLIAGLLQPWSGEIRLDGMPFNNLSVSTTTNSVGYVEQDVILFSGSVRDNITMWRTGADNITDYDVIRAAKDACIHEEITAFSGGSSEGSEYDYQLREFGKNISGGMKQRIEIARCLCKNPSILIMDEATSALDSRTEQQIDLNLRKRGCTTIVISHRLSTIRDCDEIIVLENGKVIQRGKHDDLIQENSTYSKLIEM